MNCCLQTYKTLGLFDSPLGRFVLRVCDRTWPYQLKLRSLTIIKHVYSIDQSLSRQKQQQQITIHFCCCVCSLFSRL